MYVNVNNGFYFEINKQRLGMVVVALSETIFG